MAGYERSGPPAHIMATSEDGESGQVYALPNKRPNQVAVNQVRPAYVNISPKSEDVLSPTRSKSVKAERRKSSSNSSSPSKPPLSPLSEEWEVRDAMRQRELEEARTRALQMEKTMRWWSDCTANWRDKWSQARGERNTARDEKRQLQLRLEKVMAEYAALCVDKSTGSGEHIAHARQVKTASKTDGGNNKTENSVINIIDSKINAVSDNIPTDILVDISSCHATTKRCNSFHEANDELLEPIVCGVQKHVNGSLDLLSMNSEDDITVWEERVVELRVKIEDLEKVVETEKQTNNELRGQLEVTESELRRVRIQHEQFVTATTASEEESARVKAEHQADVERISAQMEEECASRLTLDARVADLQKELERLQAEKTTDWEQRERLETERVALERRNKRLKAQVEEKAGEGVQGNDKTQEYSELRHAYSRTKKILHDTIKQLEHASQRVEQYEQEVRSQRCRVEEFKSQLALSRDKVDSQTTLITQTQRTNDDLRAQVTSLTSQINLYLRQKHGCEAATLGTSMSSLRSFEENELHVMLTHETLDNTLDERVLDYL